jgi:hypothetical protein
MVYPRAHCLIYPSSWLIFFLLNSLGLTNIIYLSKLLFLQVAQEFRFSIETVAVSVNYFDRLVSAHVIAHTQLQTHALACIYIASKQVSFSSRLWGKTPSILNTSLFYSNPIKQSSSFLHRLKLDHFLANICMFFLKFAMLVSFMLLRSIVCTGLDGT